MFNRGNTKLGDNVHGFSIPARKTCPDQTSLCSSVCYATKGRYRTNHVRNGLVKNHAAAKRPDFDRRAAAEIVTKGIVLVRVHPSGDVFSPTYAKAWVRIMRSCPETTFWLYTRGWRNQKIRSVLRQMARLKNVRVWFSADAETGLPRNVPTRVRVAWLMTRPTEPPPGPVDLVFRTKPLKKTPTASVTTGTGTTAPVCPTETGLPSAAGVTCESCKKCFEPLPDDPRPDRPTRFELATVS